MPTPSLLLPTTNTVLRLTGRYRDLTEAWVPMLRRCEREFGLVPSGPEADALRQLLIEFEQEPDLSPMGRFGTAQMHVFQRLRNVAQVKSLIREHGDIAAAERRITGAPRRAPS